MANAVKKYSISCELARKMADRAMAKAREIGVAENVAIPDDAGILKAVSRMDGTSIPTIEIARNKAYTALFGVTQEFFNFIQGEPVAFGRHPHASSRGGVRWRVSHQGGR
jgi:uncharacterized protein GlcG (DUF336 family)